MNHPVAVAPSARRDAWHPAQAAFVRCFSNCCRRGVVHPACCSTGNTKDGSGPPCHRPRCGASASLHVNPRKLSHRNRESPAGWSVCKLREAVEAAADDHPCRRYRRRQIRRCRAKQMVVRGEAALPCPSPGTSSNHTARQCVETFTPRSADRSDDRFSRPTFASRAARGPSSAHALRAAAPALLPSRNLTFDSQSDSTALGCASFCALQVFEKRTLSVDQLVHLINEIVAFP